MTGLSETWDSLFGLAGLANPVAFLIGCGLGWYADQKVKIAIAAFAAAVLSLFFDAAVRSSGMTALAPYDVGALAAFPFRLLAGAIGAGLFYLLRHRILRRGGEKNGSRSDP